MAVKISPAPSPSVSTLAAPTSFAEQRSPGSASGLSRPPVQTRDLQGCQHAKRAAGFMSQPSAQDANSNHLTRVAALAQRLRRIPAGELEHPLRVRLQLSLQTRFSSSKVPFSPVRHLRKKKMNFEF